MYLLSQEKSHDITSQLCFKLWGNDLQNLENTIYQNLFTESDSELFILNILHFNKAHRYFFFNSRPQETRSWPFNAISVTPGMFQGPSPAVKLFVIQHLLPYHCSWLSKQPIYIKSFNTNKKPSKDQIWIMIGPNRRLVYLWGYLTQCWVQLKKNEQCMFELDLLFNRWSNIYYG